MKFFLLTVHIAVLFSVSDQYKWETRETQINCNTTDSEFEIRGFCANCFEHNMCQPDGSYSSVSCSSDNICVEVEGYATCVSSSQIPECQCPGDDIVYETPDYYDDQKFIVWIGCEPKVESCPDNGYVNPDTGSCQSVTTESSLTTTLTSTTRGPTVFPPEECQGDVYEQVQVTCTTYRICFSDGTTSPVYECGTGQIFDRTEGECVTIKSFACPEEGVGNYGDPYNCTKFYFCYNGVQGEPTFCSDGTHFDDVTESCVEDTDENPCTQIKDCGVCEDGETVFPDETDCHQYFQCAEASSDSSLDYTPVLKECPDGMYFDIEGGYCDVGDCTNT